jgi:hypothetical protein
VAIVDAVAGLATEARAYGLDGLVAKADFDDVGVLTDFDLVSV